MTVTTTRRPTRSSRPFGSSVSVARALAETVDDLARWEGCVADDDGYIDTRGHPRAYGAMVVTFEEDTP